MRKINVYITKLILLLLALHTVLGCFQLLRIGSFHCPALGYTLLAACLTHAGIGIYLTLDPVKQSLKTGKWYWRANASFWIIRFSGLAIMLLLGFHLTAFTTVVNGTVFLKEFTLLSLISQLLFVSAIFIHLLYSVKPLLLAEGIMNFKARLAEFILVYVILTLFSILALFAYFIFWNFA